MRYKTGGTNGSWTEGAMVMRWMLTGIRESIGYLVQIVPMYGRGGGIFLTCME
jgi:hypothetical protein